MKKRSKRYKELTKLSTKNKKVELKDLIELVKKTSTTKFDEFPQLVNIIKGEMEFIGPRPEITGIVKEYSEYFTYLEITKPGISDIGSMIFKDESKIFKDIDINKYEYEILPVKNHLALITTENQKMIQKSMLIFLTILAVINHKLSLQIISKFLLPYDEKEFRIRLNNLLSEQIF